MGKIYDKNCAGCYYYRTLNGADHSRCCVYILFTGRSRPCPPGKDCTVKDKRSWSERRPWKIYDIGG